jgi:hypothetical protein
MLQCPRKSAIGGLPTDRRVRRVLPYDIAGKTITLILLKGARHCLCTGFRKL